MATSSVVVKRLGVERGVTSWSWLDSRHTFSFGRFVDRDWMGFGPLRVMNDDRVSGGGGFDTHPHEDMEIITVVVDGALRHADRNSDGGSHESVLRAGDVQVMSAGRGVSHSEHNASGGAGLRFIQVWIEPRERGLEPRYGERVGVGQPANELVVVVSGESGDGALDMYRDGAVLLGRFTAGGVATRSVAAGRRVWVQVVSGVVEVGGERLSEGDGLGMVGVDRVSVSAVEDALVLVFELGD